MLFPGDEGGEGAVRGKVFRLKFKFSKGQVPDGWLMRAKGRLENPAVRQPLGSALAKARDTPQLFLKKSSKKPGTFSDRFKTSQRTKGNKVSLSNPFPTDPKGQYKEPFGQKNKKAPFEGFLLFSGFFQQFIIGSFQNIANSF